MAVLLIIASTSSACHPACADTTGLQVWQYLGTIGTLAILVGYGLVNVGATRAVFDRSLGVARWRGLLPALAVILVVYVLYANIYPAPAVPVQHVPVHRAGLAGRRRGGHRVHAQAGPPRGRASRGTWTCPRAG